MSTETPVSGKKGTAKRTKAPRVPNPARASVLMALAVLFIALAAITFLSNFLLTLPCAIVSLVCAIYARRAGAPRVIVYLIVLICLIPAALGLGALLLLLLNLPLEFHLNGLAIVEK